MRRRLPPPATRLRSTARSEKRRNCAGAGSVRRPLYRFGAMVSTALFGVLAIGLLLGAVIAWLAARSRFGSEIARLDVELEHERRGSEEKVALLAQAKADFADTFRALAADALRGNNESFLQLASSELGAR